jgi:hypothetical protein
MTDRDEQFVIIELQSAHNAEYLLFPAAVPVLDCNYRSFNSARAR